jgi:hypothetical protein
MPFSAEWLALREAADAAARSQALTERLARELGPRDELRVLDLGTGAGANVRYLARPLTAARQDWLLVDNDERLLDACINRIATWAGEAGGRIRLQAGGLEADVDDRTFHIAARVVDLARSETLESLCAGRDLVTASALLDLVSGSWLRAAAAACRTAGAAILFALTYDGRMACNPADPDDETIRSLVNRHQLTDKGIGTSAGPDATSIARQCLEEVGYRVYEEPSDWTLQPEAIPLQRQLIDGWAEAAAAVDPARTTAIASWRDRRLDHLAAGRSTIVVGHRDLAAW